MMFYTTINNVLLPIIIHLYQYAYTIGIWVLHLWIGIGCQYLIFTIGVINQSYITYPKPIINFFIKNL